MTFLLFQTFLWMLSAFFLGCMLGCLAKRLVKGETAEDSAVPVGAGIGSVERAPVVEASTAPAPVTPPAPTGGIERAGTGYDYPAGIPRGAPERVQPQIQTIDLTPAEQAAAADYPVTTVGIPSGQELAADHAFPITTVGIPPGYAPLPPAATMRVEPPSEVLVPREPVQPLPQPLRPELARAGSTTSVASPVAAAIEEPVPAPAPIPVAPPAVETQVETQAGSTTSDPSSTVSSPPVAEAIEEPYPEPSPVPVAPPAVEPQAASDDLEEDLEPEPIQETIITPAVASESASGLAARITTAVPKQAAETPTGDDLTRIRAIDRTVQTGLREAGITRLAQIAKWTPADVAGISQSLGLSDRISAENWIEQAQILASGGETEYSRRRQRGEIPTQAPIPAPQQIARPAEEPAPSAAARPTVVSSMTERATALAAAAAAAASAAAGATPSSPTPARLSDALRQASGSPESAGEAGRAPRSDLTGLRSVRSEALRGDVTALETARAAGPGRGVGSFDDLKRIRGIGVLIEKKLNSVGVSTYEQIANWTNVDIDRVSQILDFKGRVERESWVEQARILASGGQTDFASRVDRGEA